MASSLFGNRDWGLGTGDWGEEEFTTEKQEEDTEVTEENEKGLLYDRFPPPSPSPCNSVLLRIPPW